MTLEIINFIIYALNPDTKDWPNTGLMGQNHSVDCFELLLKICKSVNENEIKSLIQGIKYHDFLQTFYWHAVKEKVKIRDNQACQDCKTKSLNFSLHVHHLHYNNHGSEHLHLEDLITVCDVCHSLRHGKLIDAVLTRWKAEISDNPIFRHNTAFKMKVMNCPQLLSTPTVIKDSESARNH